MSGSAQELSLANSMAVATLMGLVQERGIVTQLGAET